MKVKSDAVKSLVEITITIEATESELRDIRYDLRDIVNADTCSSSNTDTLLKSIVVAIDDVE